MKRTEITSVDEFKEFSSQFQKEHTMPYAFGIGLCFKNSTGQPIAHKWLSLNVDENMGTASALMDYFQIEMTGNSPLYFSGKNFSFTNKAVETIFHMYFHPFEDDGAHHENIVALDTIVVNDFEELSEPALIFYPTKEIFETAVASNADAHFRLAAISRLKFKPNTICLDDLFAVLPNLVWTSIGSVHPVDEWNQSISNMQIRILIDKIPLLTWGAPIPSEVRIANPDNVRLGAYLSPGTTIMHYGFVNFNAGTLGKSMVEGRISVGTTIGDGTDIGAGAGFLGTLSGGNSTKLSAGERCLIGANAECGVILGDDCVVATGTCFGQGTPIVEIDPTVKNIDDPKRVIRIGKVKDYNEKSGLTFWRHSITGALEVFATANKHKLNETLHNNS